MRSQAFTSSSESKTSLSKSGHLVVSLTTDEESLAIPACCSVTSIMMALSLFRASIRCSHTSSGLAERSCYNGNDPEHKKREPWSRHTSDNDTEGKARLKAELQHDSLVQGLQKVLEGRGWLATFAVFVGGTCGSIEEKTLATNMELLVVAGGEQNVFQKRHVWRLMKEQNRALRSY